ncbi:MAG: hypothetical protein ACFBSD_05050 [Paracoccaceae bacterium]
MTDRSDPERRLPDEATIRALFTRSDGAFRFARWGRDLAPAIFGATETEARAFREAMAAVAGLGGLRVAERDPELGANALVFVVDSWPALLEIPHTEKLIPDLRRLIGVLGATGANQYRIFGFDPAGAIRIVTTLVARDDEVRRLSPGTVALSQAVQGLLLWSDRAFLARSPIAESAGRSLVTPDIADIIRGAYAADVPAASEDPATAGRIEAALTALGERP